MILSLLPLCPVDQLNKNREHLKVSKPSQLDTSLKIASLSEEFYNL